MSRIFYHTYKLFPLDYTLRMFRMRDMGVGQEQLKLGIVPIHSIRLQEAVTQEKSVALATKMRERGEIINPVVVSPLGQDQFIQLDGASRITALTVLGAPWAFVHITNYEDVRLTSWGHATEIDPSTLEVFSYSGASGLGLVATLFSPSDSTVTALHCEDVLLKRIEAAHRLVALYRRLPETRVDLDGGNIEQGLVMAKQMGPAGVLIKYPTYSPQEVMHVVSTGALMPPGVTKHHLQRRVLMRLPLAFLLDRNIDETGQQERLNDYISQFTFHPYRDEVVYEAEQWK